MPLDLVLVGEAPRVHGLAIGPHQYQLAQPHAGMNPKRTTGDVAHLEDLPVSHPRLHEGRGDVHHQAEPRKATAPLQETTDIGRQAHPLAGNPVNRDTRLEHEALGETLDASVIAEVGLLLNLEGFVSFLDHANLVAQGEIDGRDANARGNEGIYLQSTRLDFAKDDVACQDGHFEPHVIVSAMSHPYFAVEGPMILGHRGAAGCAPENTLLSFARCLEQGAHAIESDVQITADGVPVLMHDPDVGRTTNGAGAVDAMTRAELEKLDAGHTCSIEERGTSEFGDEGAFRGQGIQVPSLESAFGAFPEARFNLEIKTAAYGAVQKVVGLVAEFDRADRTLLTAGDVEIMQALRDALSELDVGAATSASVSDVVAVVHSAVERSAPPEEVQALQIPSHFAGRELVTELLVSHCHEHEVPLHVWTVNEIAEMERLLELGVDGLITDFPGRLARLLRA